MSTLGPAAHRRFCQIDGWDNPDGTNHDKWEKRLPDRRVLRTTISRNKREYGAALKAGVLRQLEVDEATLWEVLATGQPARRPTPEEAPGPAPLAGWAVQALIHHFLTEGEIRELTGEEAEALANYSFTLPESLTREAVRAELFAEQERHRDR